MLVLSRRVGERILIGENIAITVVRINGNNVRVGVEAPTELRVVRDELIQSPFENVRMPNSAEMSRT